MPRFPRLRKAASKVVHAAKVLGRRQLSKRAMAKAARGTWKETRTEGGTVNSDFRIDPRFGEPVPRSMTVVRKEHSKEGGEIRVHRQMVSGTDRAAELIREDTRYYTLEGKLKRKEIYRQGLLRNPTEKVIEYDPPGRFFGKRKKK